MSEIDLSLLPAPDVIETLDFEAVLAELKADFVVRYPDAADIIDLESEPVVKLLETCAYRETILRARINDAARACLLAYGGGADLDHLAALFNVERLTVQAANPQAVPPVAAVMEADADLRRRVQMALESATVAGSRGSYVFQALSAHGDVADAAIDSPAPGVVHVAVLSRLGDGTPGADLLAAVNAKLSAADVRPLTDQVVVEPAQIVPFAVDATLHVAAGPAPDIVRGSALSLLTAYLGRPRRIGAEVPLSALYACLHRDGVVRVTLRAPAQDIAIGPRQAAYCTGISLDAVVEDAP